MCDDLFDITWEEMAMAGSLAEEMREEERERRLLEQEFEDEDDDCLCDEYDPYNPSDDDPYP